MKREKLFDSLLPLFTLAVIFILWGVTAAAVGNEYILPSVASVAKEFIALFRKGEFYISFLYTFLRSVIAFVISFSLAFLAAFGSYKSETFKTLFRPVLMIVRALPTIAIVLLLIFWTTSSAAAITVTVLVVFPTLYNGIYQAFCGIDGEITEMCILFKVSKKKIIFSIELPAIAPDLLAWTGAGISLNLKLMVAAEVLSAASNSLGNLLSAAKYNAEIPVMMALVVVSVAAGIITESIFSLLSAKAGKWR